MAYNMTTKFTDNRTGEVSCSLVLIYLHAAIRSFITLNSFVAFLVPVPSLNGCNLTAPLTLELLSDAVAVGIRIFGNQYHIQRFVFFILSITYCTLFDFELHRQSRTCGEPSVSVSVKESERLLQEEIALIHKDTEIQFPSIWWNTDCEVCVHILYSMY